MLMLSPKSATYKIQQGVGTFFHTREEAQRQRTRDAQASMQQCTLQQMIRTHLAIHFGNCANVFTMHLGTRVHTFAIHFRSQGPHFSSPINTRAHTFAIHGSPACRSGLSSMLPTAWQRAIRRKNTGDTVKQEIWQRVKSIWQRACVGRDRQVVIAKQIQIKN